MTRPAYSAISSYSRVEILHLLQETPGRTIAELCEHTGLHANTVREHLQRLVDAGHVVQEREHRTTRGRPRLLYSAASPEVDAENAVITQRAEEAARRGDLMRRVMPDLNGPLEGQAVHQLDAVIDDLQESGFDPIVDEEALTIDLTPCKHSTSQAGHRETLCTVHLNLIDNVLTAAKGPLRVAGMHPSCDPTNCVVQLMIRSEDDDEDATA